MKTNTAKETVSFERTYDFTCLAELIEQQYPSLSSGKIQDAIDACIIKTKPPRQRIHFIKLLKQELGIE